MMQIISDLSGSIGTLTGAILTVVTIVEKVQTIKKNKKQYAA